MRYTPVVVIKNARERRSAEVCVTNRLRTAGICEQAINEAVAYAHELINKDTPLFTSIHQAVTTAKQDFCNYTGPFAA